MSSVNYDLAESVGKVLHRIKEKESDSDHVHIISSALDRLWEMHGTRIDVNTEDLNSEDVKKAFNFMKESSDRDFEHALEFVDLEERYSNGCLPSFRDWHVEYVNNGEVIEERTYDHDDEIPIEPEIDGIRYECDRTKRGSGEVVVYVSENPVRDDVDLVIKAEGDDFINIESHCSNKDPIEILSQEFKWGMLGDDKIIVKNDDPSNVVEFIEEKGWEFDRD